MLKVEHVSIESFLAELSPKSENFIILDNQVRFQIFSKVVGYEMIVTFVVISSTIPYLVRLDYFCKSSDFIVDEMSQDFTEAYDKIRAAVENCGFYESTGVYN